MTYRIVRMTLDRECIECKIDKDNRFFSKIQWSRGVLRSKCNTCIYDGIENYGIRTREAANENLTQGHGAFATSGVFATGTLREVAMEKYTLGPRTNQLCVFKWLKSSLPYEEDYFFNKDLKVVDKAIEIIDTFNDFGFAGRGVNWTVRMNRPAIVEMSGRKAQMEPLIRNFEKYNSVVQLWWKALDLEV